MDLKSFALRLFLTIPALGSVPGARLVPGEVRPLYAVGASTPLSTGYGLKVVTVPPPPVGLVPTLPPGPSCPIEVRAIVGGETSADTFVVVAVGDESAVLKRGQGIRTKEGWVAISNIAADRIVLRKGDEAFDCFLGGSFGTVPPVEEPAR